jgi:hypothetical protein
MLLFVDRVLISANRSPVSRRTDRPFEVLLCLIPASLIVETTKQPKDGRHIVLGQQRRDLLDLSNERCIIVFYNATPGFTANSPNN